MPLFTPPDRTDAPWARRRDELIRALCGLVERAAVPWHDAQVLGLDRVPEGPALFVGNHSGATLTIDTFIFGARLIRERGIRHLPYGLAHDLGMAVPGISHLLDALGAVPANHANASALFDAGCKVMVYPGGDVDAMRPYSARNEVRFGGRTGFARLAIRHGVPIVPVATAGAHRTLIILTDLAPVARAIGADRALRLKVWPVALSIPWGLTIGPMLPYFPLPAPIITEVLEPITFDRTGEEAAGDDAWVQACADDVHARLQQAVTRLSEQIGDAT